MILSGDPFLGMAIQTVAAAERFTAMAARPSMLRPFRPAFDTAQLSPIRDSIVMSVGRIRQAGVRV